MNTTSHYTLINKQDIEKIKSKFFQKKSNRIILHTKSSIQQEMIIAQKKIIIFQSKKIYSLIKLLQFYMEDF